MKDLIEVFRMKEVDKKTRAKILTKLGELINYKYAANITEPIVYELVKQLDRSLLESDPFLKRYILATRKEAEESLK